MINPTLSENQQGEHLTGFNATDANENLSYKCDIEVCGSLVPEYRRL
jgi:hypothetical protein